MRSPAGAPSRRSPAWTWQPRQSASWWKSIPSGSALMLSVGLCVQLACVWEATARKPGNVHRFRDFEDAHYLDFVTAAAAVGPILGDALFRLVGTTVHEAVRQVRSVVRGNTHLGAILLLAPLAKVAREPDLRASVER